MRLLLSGALRSTTRRARRTEARQCIHEVLTDFRKLELHAYWYRMQPSGTADACSFPSRVACFEQRVQESGLVPDVARGGPSCGKTMLCFASLFLSRAQISSGYASFVVSGGWFRRLYNLPNFAWTAAALATGQASLRSQISPAPSRSESTKRRLSRTIALSVLRFSGCLGPRIVDLHRARAASTVQKLAEALRAHEEWHHLPRVFFCNLAWLLGRGAAALADDVRADRVRKPRSVWDIIAEDGQEHEFAIIKRPHRLRQEHEGQPNVFEYQVIQGYLPSATERGFYLFQWQASRGRWSSPEGFGSEELQHFIDHLESFTFNESWDGASYAQCFGVREDRFVGHAYWPSFSFRELQDAAILGHGERPLSNHLARS